MNMIVRDLGLCDWLKINREMKDFTNQRDSNSIDELWFVEHFPVFTYGLLETKNYGSNIKGIPVLYANRGGKITYHGPGQLVIYFLIDLRRKKIKFYKFVKNSEILIIKLLRELNILSHLNNLWPGIYVNKKKICSLGFRITRGCSLYGLSLNIKMDLTPFSYINPCGNKTIIMTQVDHFKKNVSMQKIKNIFIKNFCKLFNYLVTYD